MCVVTTQDAVLAAETLGMGHEAAIGKKKLLAMGLEPLAAPLEPPEPPPAPERQAAAPVAAANQDSDDSDLDEIIHLPVCSRPGPPTNHRRLSMKAESSDVIAETPHLHLEDDESLT